MNLMDGIGDYMRLKKCMQVERCPKCKMRNENNECVALSSTYFSYKCPFYKQGDHNKFKLTYKEEGDNDYEEKH